MALTNLTADVEIISKLDNDPSDDSGMTPALLKSKFDAGSKAIKEFINSTLIPELNVSLEGKLSAALLASAVEEAAGLALEEAISNGSFDGADGREIELRISDTQIQWRYKDEGFWTNLISLSAYMDEAMSNLEIEDALGSYVGGGNGELIMVESITSPEIEILF